MNIRPSAVPWIIAAVALFFAGALAYGLSQGALLVPGKGFQTTVQRASNPLGFYLLAVFYAALAGLAVYLLVAVIKADPRPTAGSQRPARPVDIGQRVQAGGIFEITQDGRGGQVIARLASGSHAFWWEFGGGDCIAIISVPTEEQWTGIPALASYPREELLRAMAEDVGRRQCPGAQAIIDADSIVFKA